VAHTFYVAKNAEHRLVSSWVPHRLADQLQAAAQRSERSVSAELRVALREHLERNLKEQP